MSSFIHCLLRPFKYLYCSAAILILVLVFVVLNVFLPSRAKFSTFSFSYKPMGTYCRMVVDTEVGQGAARSAADAALSEILAIEALASTYQPHSEISRLANIKPGFAYELSPHMYTVFERSLYYSRLTDGAFDITVGPLMKLWRAAAQRDTLPSSAEIATALDAVGYRSIALDPAGRTITLARPRMSITLDAIVKGYAADLALAAIRQAGAQAALIDLGGDIVCYGSPPGQPGWNIAIQNPFKPATRPMDTSPGSLLGMISLTDAAVATSGNYQRNFSIQGRAYSQIIDPRTGQPVSQAPSVTIIAPTAADADALATACSVLPVAQALELINKIPHTQALLITGSPDAPIFHTSTGFNEYLLAPLPASAP